MAQSRMMAPYFALPLERALVTISSCSRDEQAHIEGPVKFLVARGELFGKRNATRYFARHIPAEVDARGIGQGVQEVHQVTELPF